jgi:hypothetical protein
MVIKKCTLDESDKMLLDVKGSLRRVIQ